MVNHWHNITYRLKQHKYRIFSMLESIALFIALYFLTKIFNASLCPIYHIFGKKCFGCGMTRAFISILQLDFISAVNYNLLSIPLFIGIVTYCLFLLTDIIFDKKHYCHYRKNPFKKIYVYYIFFSFNIKCCY